MNNAGIGLMEGPIWEASYEDMDFAIAINATRGRCTLSDLDLGNRNDCRVEIYDAAGRTLSVTLWKRAETEKVLPVSAAEGSVLVVKVSDTANGRQLTRRIIVK